MFSKTPLDRRAYRSWVLAQLQRLGVRPRRSAGQNLLIDPSVAAELVAAADVHGGETVLEVGPGLGVVTEALVENGAKVVAVELDRMFAHWIERHFDSTRVEVVARDILKVDLNEHVRDGQYKVVSSLPFNVTSRLLRNMLEHPPRPIVMSLLIQKEVAERITAAPGEMSLLSVAVQYLGIPQMVRVVPKELFWPQPGVDGAMIRIEVKALPSTEERKALFRAARVGFSARRKMLYNNLSNGLRITPAHAKEIVRRVGLDERCRAQDVNVDSWKKLATMFL